jgi:hypothetical protein
MEYFDREIEDCIDDMFYKYEELEPFVSGPDPLIPAETLSLLTQDQIRRLACKVLLHHHNRIKDQLLPIIVGLVKCSHIDSDMYSVILKYK